MKKFFVFSFLILLAVAIIVRGNRISASISDGLIAYYPLDDGAAIDTAGNNSGVLAGPPTAAIDWKIGSGALFFDGKDKISTSSDFLGTSPLTISAWVYAVSTGGSSTGMIINNSKTLLKIGFNNRLIFSSNGGSGIHAGNNSLPLHIWKHVVVTRDAAGVANFYINGVVKGAINQNSGLPVAGLPVAIGNRANGSPTMAWSGIIDDLRVYNRVLSSSEIYELFSFIGSTPTPAITPPPTPTLTPTTSPTPSVTPTPVPTVTATPTPSPSPVAVDLYVDMESGSSGDILTLDTLNSATHGSGGFWSITSGTMQKFAVNGVETQLNTPVIIDSTSYNDLNGSRSWEYDHMIANESARYSFSPIHDKVSVGAFLKFGPNNTFGYYDFLQITGYTNGQTCALQLKDFPSPNRIIWAHTTPSSGPTSGSPIAVTHGKLYWASLQFNNITHLCSVALFDPVNWQQVGLTSISPMDADLARSVVIGVNGHNNVSSAKSYFEDVLIDWTEGKFPLGVNF